MIHAFICHPYSGQPLTNLAAVEDIITLYAGMRPKQYVPIINWYAYVRALDDKIKENREIGLEWNFEAINRCDELHVWGNHVSKGMYREVYHALSEDIPVIAKTDEVAAVLRKNGFVIDYSPILNGKPATG